MSVPLEFWFDFASTYSYPAAFRVADLTSQQPERIKWRPFLLGPVFKQFGWDDSPFNIYESKGAYMWRDLERICLKQQLPFRRPTVFPRDRLLVTRIACRFSGESWLPDFVRAIYSANFETDSDISDIDVVLSCLPKNSESPHDIVKEAVSDDSKLLLRQQTALAMEKGIFGAPTFTVGEEIFWGQDRLEDALEWATADTTNR